MVTWEVVKVVIHSLSAQEVTGTTVAVSKVVGTTVAGGSAEEVTTAGDVVGFGLTDGS